MTYKLVIDSFPKDQSNPPKLIVHSSSSVGSIHHPTPATTGVHEILQDAIPPEWQSQMSDLFQQEYTIIDQRRALLASLRTQFQDIATPILDNLPKTHPELLI